MRGVDAVRLRSAGQSELEGAGDEQVRVAVVNGRGNNRQIVRTAVRFDRVFLGGGQSAARLAAVQRLHACEPGEELRV